MTFIDQAIVPVAAPQMGMADVTVSTVDTGRRQGLGNPPLSQLLVSIAEAERGTMNGVYVCASVDVGAGGALAG